MRITTGRRLGAILGLLLAVAARAGAQDTGAISGTIVDNSSQVVPGATVTLAAERTSDTRTAVSGARGEFAFRAVPPGSYTVKVELPGFRTLELKQQRPQRQRPARSRRPEARRRHAQRSRHRRLRRERRRNQEQRLLGPPDVDPDLADADQGARRHVAAAAAAWRQVRERHRGDGRQLRLERAEHRRPAAGVEPGHRRRHERQRAVGHGALLLGDQSRCDRGSQGPAEHLQGGVRAQRRREHPDRQQERQRRLPRQRLLVRAGARPGTPRRGRTTAAGWPSRNTTSTRSASISAGRSGFPGCSTEAARRRLFFFYSLEAPQVQRPGQVRLYRMPTELERRGDFSQTRNPPGRLIFIKDPNIDRGVQRYDRRAGVLRDQRHPGGIGSTRTRAAVNIAAAAESARSQRDRELELHATGNLRQPALEQPAARGLAARPAATTFGVRCSTFNSNQYGSEITAGPAKWGYFNGAYIFSDSSVNGGWNQHLRLVARQRIPDRASAGRPKDSRPTTEADWTHIRRSDIGWTVPQYFPEVNTLDVMPRVTFGLARRGAGIDSPDFTFDQRLGETAEDWLLSVRDNFTWTRGRHTFKAGGYVEFMQNNEARGGPWPGEFTFNNTTTNPLNTNYAYANALLGGVRQLPGDRDAGVDEQPRVAVGVLRAGYVAGAPAPDAWTTAHGSSGITPYCARTTDLELRSGAVRSGAGAAAVSAGARQRRARRLRRAHGQTCCRSSTSARTFPEPASRTTAWSTLATACLEASANGWRRGSSRGWASTFDLTGEGTTVLHASAGLFHNAVLGGGSFGNLRNPPFFVTPALPNATIGTMFAPGISLVNAAAEPQRDHLGLRAAELPQLVDRPPPRHRMGHRRRRHLRRQQGPGSRGPVRHQRRARRCALPGRESAERRSVDRGPSAARRLVPAARTAVTAPFASAGRLATRTITPSRSRPIVATFAACSSAAPTRGSGHGGFRMRTETTSPRSIHRPIDYFYSILAQSPTHTVVINYSWDLPETGMTNPLVRGLLNGWQISGENAFVAGDWAPVTFTTADNFDFTGGDGGQGQDVNGVRFVASERHGRSDGQRRRSDCRMVRHRRLQPPGGTRGHRQLAAQRRAAARHQHLEPGAVQERAVRRQPRVPVPGRGLQRAQPHAVQRHRPRRDLQHDGGADGPELRHRDRHRQPDASAARDSAVGSLEFLKIRVHCLISRALPTDRVRWVRGE